MAQAELGINIKVNNQARGALKSIQGDLKGIQSSLGSVMKIAAGNFISAAAVAGVKALGSAVTGVVGGLTQASMAAADFNAQISGIGAVAGASASQLGELKQLALDLGVDPNLKVSAVEAAQAIEMLARNGLKVPQIMDGAAKATVLLANATGADFATAADIGTDAMALFGIQANEMIKAVDGITSVTNNSKFSINDYRLALAQGGGVAATVGVSFADFNATIAGIAPLFGSGSDAGTSFKTFLQRLVPETDRAKDAMAELGLLTKDGSSVFFDASGKMKDMAEVSAILGDATRNLTEEQKIHYLSTIFGTDAMRAAAGVAKQGEVVYTDLEKASRELGISQAELNKYIEGGITSFEILQAQMSKTSATDSAAQRMDNLAGDMEIFRSVVESVRIQIGDEFQPALRDMFQAATGALSTLQPVIVNFAARVGQGISGAIENVRTAKTEFDTILQSFGDNRIGGILAGLGTLTGGTVAFDAEAQIVSVDWTSKVLGTITGSYDAVSQIISVDWTGGWLTGVGTAFTYDADAKVLSVDWESDVPGIMNGFTYDAQAGITKVNWQNETGFHFIYNADAQVLSVDFGIFKGTYDATAGITDVAWGAFTHTYNSESQVTNVLWGFYTTSYDVVAQISEQSVFWGAYTHTYDALAKIGSDSVLWGAYTHTYDAMASITDVLWGLWTHTYDAVAKVSNDSVLWGLWNHTYDANAEIGTNSVLWGTWTWTYDADANITSIGKSESLNNRVDVVGNVTSVEGSGLDQLKKLTVTASAEVLNLISKLVITPPPESELGPLLTIRTPTLTSDFWPSFPTWTWPTIETSLFAGWPSIPTSLFGGWPSIPAPSWGWPEIPRPGWLDTLLRIFNTGVSVNNAGPNRNGRVGGGSAPGFDSDGTFNYGFNATGTDFWEGGWTWVGEEGPELLNLPRGARILSNPDSMKMIGQMADGTGLPAGGGVFDGLTKALGFFASVFDNTIGEQAKKTEELNSATTANTEAIDSATKSQQDATQTARTNTTEQSKVLATTGELIRVSAQQFAQAATGTGNFVVNGIANFTQSFSDLLDSFGGNLQSALQAVPGLFGASQVTADQMKLAELGIDQNFADDWLRRLTDEVMNGVDWEGVDIADAAKRAGIDGSLPAQEILRLVTQAWNDQSLFADKANLDLFNMDAVQAELLRQQASAAGQANILALFGITPEQATQAGVSAGTNMRSGVTQGLSQTTGEGEEGSSLATSIIGQVAPDQFASVGVAAVEGILAELKKPENGSQIAHAVAGIFADVKAYGDAFASASSGILNAIARGFGEVDGIDMAGKLASSMRKNLDLEESIKTMKDVGARILEYVFRGYETAAKKKDWAYATVGSAPEGSGTTTAGQNAIGTRNWRGGLTWVGETGPELVALPRGSGIYSNSDSMAMAGAGGINVTVNVASVANDLDIERAAYRIADIIQRRRGR